MINAIIFDLGGVLIDWNPKYLFNKIFDNEEQVNHFLETICTSDWNEEQDAGRTLEEATETLVREFPVYETEIRAYYSRWDEMLGGAIGGTVDILQKLKQNKALKVYALTNWSSETFPIARERYEFLNWFDGIVVSGDEKMRKPFPQFYKLLLDRYNVKAEEALFIDDNKRNVDAAKALGIDSILFTDSSALSEELNKRDIHI